MPIRQTDRLTITNSAGANVVTLSDLGTGATITTGQLPAGVYVITVKAAGKTYYKKVALAGN